MTGRNTAALAPTLLLALLTGCADPPPAADAGVTVDAGAVDDAGLDAGAPLPTCESEPCTLVWTAGPEMETPLDHHTTAVIMGATSPWLTVVGGVRTEDANIVDMYETISIARIALDGSLGDWGVAARLSMPISFHAQAMLADGRVVLLGGVSQDATGPFALPNVTFLRVDADGALDLSAGAPLPGAFRHATAEVIGDRLFLIGGLGTSGPQDRVVSATVAPGGVNAAWEDEAPLPRARTHHASVAHAGRIYVFGGYDPDQVASPEILRSTHDAAGRITGWETVGTWERPRWTSSAFVHDGWVYLLGGGVFLGGGAAENLDSVIRAELTEAGIGPFEEVDAPLPVGRSHVHQAPMHGGFVYSVGGRTGASFTSTGAVQIGRLAP